MNNDNAERLIATSHLPENKLKRAIFSYKIPDGTVTELHRLGIIPYFCKGSGELDERISHHPDMSIFCGGKGRFSARKDCKPLFEEIIKDIEENENAGFSVEYSKSEQVTRAYPLEYPFDIGYNCFVFRKHLFCGSIIAQEIEDLAQTDELKTVRVKQGYVKCSTCIVSKSAIITEDKSVYNAIKNNCKDVDVLYIKKREVILEGYDCGFIGGASFKISKDMLAFFGKIENHGAYSDIKSFCSNHGVNCISLSSDSVTDYGGAICVTEQIG